jgi:hypothetical protein
MIEVEGTKKLELIKIAKFDEPYESHPGED